MQRLRQLLYAVCIILCCLIARAQQRPTIASARDLELNPRILDGQLVRIRGRLGIGWEGDNFLYDLPSSVAYQKTSRRPAAVWFYAKPGYEHQVWDAIRPTPGYFHGTLTGYFHYEPYKRYRHRGVFDPGPLQLEVIEVSDVEKERQ